MVRNAASHGYLQCSALCKRQFSLGHTFPATVPPTLAKGLELRGKLLQLKIENVLGPSWN